MTTLDDINWILNLRGSDIPYNPVFFAYLLLNASKEGHPATARLFINPSKVEDEDVKAQLKENHVDVFDYSAITGHLSELVAEKKVIGYDENICNQQLFELFKDAESKPVVCAGFIEGIKAVKNTTEMEGMRKVNIKNCASLIEFFSWMEEHLKTTTDSDMDEFVATEKLEDFRRTRELYMGPSFDTISSMGPNGAVIHYKPKKGDCLKMNNKEIYLLDSGVQYLDGTTDITRSVHFGGAEPTAEQRDRYTRVLLGVLDLERVVWPKGGPFSGSDFDTLARRHLWEDGVDYKHGTGHGVGSFNCVHEGPQGISRRSYTKLETGMCVSNEPGFYKDGEYGIRIENVIMVIDHAKLTNSHKFENLTFCPYERRLIDLDLLAPKDRKYLDTFHSECEEKLTPLLQGNDLALAYLKRQCAPL